MCVCVCVCMCVCVRVLHLLTCIRVCQVEGDVLRITRTRMEDRDLYICSAENAVGSARAAGIVDVEREFRSVTSNAT